MQSDQGYLSSDVDSYDESYNYESDSSESSYSSSSSSSSSSSGSSSSGEEQVLYLSENEGHIANVKKLRQDATLRLKENVQREINEWLDTIQKLEQR